MLPRLISRRLLMSPLLTRGVARAAAAALLPRRDAASRAHQQRSRASPRRAGSRADALSRAHKSIQVELMQGSLAQVLRIISARARAFDSMNEITALMRITKESELVQNLDFAALEDHEAVQTLLSRIESRLLRDGYEARALSSAAYALARLGFGADRCSARIWRLLAERSAQRIETFDAQNLSNTAWAFASANLSARSSPLSELFAALAPVAEQRAAEFTPQGLSNVAWALSMSEDVSPFVGTVAALAERALAPRGQDGAGGAMAGGDDGEVAGGEGDAEVGDGAGSEASGERASLRASESGAGAGGSDSGGRGSGSDIGSGSDSDSSSLSQSAALDEHRVAHSIGSALLTASLAFPRTADEPVALRVRALLAKALARLQAPVEQQVVSSRSHLELSEALCAAGWPHKCEVSLSGGLLVLDMACTRMRIAVEFDGPWHYRRRSLHARRALFGPDTGEASDAFFGAEAEAYDGRTRWKSRVLHALGWRVFRVGWREWEALAGDAERKREYGERLVAKIVAAHERHASKRAVRA